MKFPRIAALVLVLALMSCAAKNAPTRLTVKVADTFSGAIRLSPCAQSASEPVLLDAGGNGSTSACPSADDVEIMVMKAGKTIYLAREQVKIARAGDGFPVLITANIP
jgi:hypothetical protein